MDIGVVIPARMESSRLPGKPLLDLSGIPMIVRTANQVAQVLPRSQILIATDSIDVVEVCERFGYRATLTAHNHATGTDRVAEAAESLEADLILNVQGDEPVFPPDDLESFISAAVEHPDEVHVGFCPATHEEVLDPKYVKVVVALDRRVMYMSRAPIPASKQGFSGGALRQVCVYSLPRPQLRAFASVGSKTPMESIEDVEAVRFLELGIKVRGVALSSNSMSVDVPSDVDRVISRIIED